MEELHLERLRPRSRNRRRMRMPGSRDVASCAAVRKQADLPSDRRGRPMSRKPEFGFLVAAPVARCSHVGMGDGDDSAWGVPVVIGDDGQGAYVTGVRQSWCGAGCGIQLRSARSVDLDVLTTLASADGSAARLRPAAARSSRRRLVESRRHHIPEYLATRDPRWWSLFVAMTV